MKIVESEFDHPHLPSYLPPGHYVEEVLRGERIPNREFVSRWVCLRTVRNETTGEEDHLKALRGNIGYTEITPGVFDLIDGLEPIEPTIHLYELSFVEMEDKDTLEWSRLGGQFPGKRVEIILWKIDPSMEMEHLIWEIKCSPNAVINFGVSKELEEKYEENVTDIKNRLKETGYPVNFYTIV